MELTQLDYCIKWLSGDALAKLKARLPQGRWVYRGSEKYDDVTYHFFSALGANKSGKRKRVTLEDRSPVMTLPYADPDHRPMVEYEAAK